MTEQFWIHDHCILFKKSKLMELWPYKHMTYNQQLNATSRFIIMVSLIGYMLLNNYIILLFGALMLILIATVYKYNKTRTLESMSNKLEGNNVQHNYSSKNPFQNVLMTDFEDNPTRLGVPTEYGEKEEAMTNNEVKKFILENNKDNEDIHKIFGTLGNEMEFENSMRNFHVNPSTTIPNSQSDFLKFCYNTLYSGKPLNVY